MKRVKTLVVLVAVLIAFSAIAFAQESGQIQRPMMDKEMKAGKMKSYSMHGMMMKKMMERQMVATEDGGVVVMVGNKLLKYDKNLKLVKEAELKIDYEAMKKKFKEKCARYKEGMEKKEDSGEE